eukprot:2511496-Prymnesium_polylepis.1
MARVTHRCSGVFEMPARISRRRLTWTSKASPVRRPRGTVTCTSVPSGVCTSMGWPPHAPVGTVTRS